VGDAHFGEGCEEGEVLLESEVDIVGVVIESEEGLKGDGGSWLGLGVGEGSCKHVGRPRRPHQG
jgi:hypothetical protein